MRDADDARWLASLLEFGRVPQIGLRDPHCVLLSEVLYLIIEFKGRLCRVLNGNSIHGQADAVFRVGKWFLYESDLAVGRQVLGWHHRDFEDIFS